MKKQTSHNGRILGRRLARELTREELEKAAGSEESAAVSTWTMTYPPDGPYKDSGGGGPVVTTVEA